ncbi:hypothetical protein D3C76_1379050 [compost metagenome]
MQQGCLRQIGRFWWPNLLGEIVWRADRRQDLIKQMMHHQPFALRFAKHHRRIKMFAAKIQPVRHRRGQFDMHLWPFILQANNTRQYPAHRTGWAFDA